MEAVRQLSLVKGKHRYVFRYQTGREADIIAAFAALAADSEAEFDWFDAAVLELPDGPSPRVGPRASARVGTGAATPGDCRLRSARGVVSSQVE